MLDQAQYRERFHFRGARLIETGEQVFVDDNTFDPAVHEEDREPAPEGAE